MYQLMITQSVATTRCERSLIVKHIKYSSDVTGIFLCKNVAAVGGDVITTNIYPVIIAITFFYT